MACVTPGELVEAGVDRVLTQYRESPKLLHVIRTYLGQVETVINSICDLPTFFQIETAVGDQLTLLGKRLGWPRCHCVCVVQPVFGFACDEIEFDTPIVGFCVGASWIDCNNFSVSDVCIDDDETYRSFLYSRLYQVLSFYDIESLKISLQKLWGPTAWVVEVGKGRIVIAPGRELTTYEEILLKLVPRVLPVALGVKVFMHFGTRQIFGFGDGWGGFCIESDINPLNDEFEEIITDEDDDPIMTEFKFIGADWMCEIDVKPYDC